MEWSHLSILTDDTVYFTVQCTGVNNPMDSTAVYLKADSMIE